MKKLILILALLPMTAQAVDFEFGLGEAKFEKPDNGTWWQNGFASNFNSKTQSWQAAVSGDTPLPHLGWSFGYVDLGSMNSFALATPNDANYNGRDGCVGKCLPMANIYGSTHVGGWFGTLEPNMMYHGVKLFTDIGLWRYNPSGGEYANNIIYVPGTTPLSANFPYTGGSKYGYVFGIGAQYEHVKARITVYDTHIYGAGEYPPNFGAHVINTSLSWVF